MTNRSKNITSILLNALAFLMGASVIGWQIWFAPQYLDLNAQGRLNEADSQGCLIGLLTLPTLIFSPMFILTGFAMSLVSFIWGWRKVSIVGFAINLIALIVFGITLYLIFR